MDTQITLGDLFNHPASVPVVQFLLFTTITVFLVVMVYLQTRKDALDLRWLILDTSGKPSIHKIGQLVALMVSTWGFVVLTLKGNLSESYFGIYMAVWTSATAVDTYINGKRNIQSSTN